jgi:hypothetical protein
MRKWILILALINSLYGMAQQKICITINGSTFSATVDDTETGNAFMALLPMTIKMNELNGNEKYCYLDTSLPTNSSSYATINNGDLLLYGNSCIVLFYKTFSSGYSYTPIGKVDDPSSLASVVGSGNISAMFETATAGIEAVNNDDAGLQDVYSIDGRKVNPDRHGIYIKNKKKIIL